MFIPKGSIEKILSKRFASDHSRGDDSGDHFEQVAHELIRINKPKKLLPLPEC